MNKNEEIRKIVRKEIKSALKESSLNRAYEHSQTHDTGFITAYRGSKTRKENKLSNRALSALLQSKGYGITKVKGAYIEDYNTPDAKEVGESTFMVVDIKNKGNLKKTLLKLGEEFEQDSIIFSKKGETDAYLIGTKKNSFPGYHREIHYKNGIYGKSGEFMTRVNGRPFIFKENIQELSFATNIMGQFGCYSLANEILNELDKRS
jgi:hypothetical protein